MVEQIVEIFFQAWVVEAMQSGERFEAHRVDAHGVTILWQNIAQERKFNQPLERGFNLARGDETEIEFA